MATAHYIKSFLLMLDFYDSLNVIGADKVEAASKQKRTARDKKSRLDSNMFSSGKVPQGADEGD